MLLKCKICGKTFDYNVLHARTSIKGEVLHTKCMNPNCANYVWTRNNQGAYIGMAKRVVEIEKSDIVRPELEPLYTRSNEKLKAQTGIVNINKSKGDSMSWYKSALVSTVLKILGYLFKDLGVAEIALDKMEDKTRGNNKLLYTIVIVARSVLAEWDFADKKDEDYYTIKEIVSNAVKKALN